MFFAIPSHEAKRPLNIGYFVVVSHRELCHGWYDRDNFFYYHVFVGLFVSEILIKNTNIEQIKTRRKGNSEWCKEVLQIHIAVISKP